MIWASLKQAIHNRRRIAPLALAIIVLIVTLAAFAFIRGLLRFAAHPDDIDTNATTTSCFYVEGNEESCRYIELMERGRLPFAEIDNADNLQAELNGVVSAITFSNCDATGASACGGVVMRRLPSGEDVAAASKEIALLGYEGAIVKLAGDGDPAAPGSLFFAVPAGESCLMGYFEEIPNKLTRKVLGTIPDGKCM